MNEQEIGQAMKAKRGDRPIRKVAEAAGIAPHQIISIEKAKTNYTVQTLLKLAKEIGSVVSVDGELLSFAEHVARMNDDFLQGDETNTECLESNHDALMGLIRRARRMLTNLKHPLPQ